MTRPRGSGLVLLIRRNWSRCSSIESATNALTGTGKSCRRDSGKGQSPLLAINDPAGFPPVTVRKGDLQGPGHRADVIITGSATAGETDGGRQRDDDRVRKQDAVAIEVLGDFLHVLADLGTLVSDQVTCVVPTDPRDVGDLAEFPGGKTQAGTTARRSVCVTRSARRLSRGRCSERSRCRLRHCAVQPTEPVLFASEPCIPEFAQQSVGGRRWRLG